MHCLRQMPCLLSTQKIKQYFSGIGFFFLLILTSLSLFFDPKLEAIIGKMEKKATFFDFGYDYDFYVVSASVLGKFS